MEPDSPLWEEEELSGNLWIGEREREREGECEVIRIGQTADAETNLPFL